MAESADITPKVVQCPNCHKFWELEETERKSTVFTCPSCNKIVDMATLTDELYTIESGNVVNKESENESTKTKPGTYEALADLKYFLVLFALIVVVVIIGFLAGNGHEGNVSKDSNNVTNLARAGCERYWLRLRGELPTPDMPAPMVRTAVESALQRFLPAPGESAVYLRVAQPGFIDSNFRSVPRLDYVDPWENVYVLELHSDGAARAVSAGPDGEMGTWDDIAFPTVPEPLEWQ